MRVNHNSMIVPGQEANEDNHECLFDLKSNGMLSVLIRIASLLMSTRNIHFHDTIEKFT